MAAATRVSIPTSANGLRLQSPTEFCNLRVNLSISGATGLEFSRCRCLSAFSAGGFGNGKGFRRGPIFPVKANSDESGDVVEVDNLGVKVALSILNFYKREISPLLPRSCRYVPTCSEYSMEAYKKYGVVKGTILTGWRICRCNPLGGTGFDPPRWFDEPPPPPAEED